MNEGIVQIILAVITLLGTVVTVIVAPYIRAKYTAEKRAEAYEYIQVAVMAADQILKLQDPTGKKRKEFVLRMLEEKGLKLTENELNILIEAAVKELNLITQEALG